MDFRKHSMLCYKIATKRQYGVTQKRNIQRVRVKVHYPLSPLNIRNSKRARHFDAPSCCFVLMYFDYDIGTRDGLGLMAKNSFYDG